MKTIKQNPMYMYLLVLTIASAAGLQGWRTLFNNFAVENAQLNGFQVGITQAVREIPGFLALLAIFLLYLVKEARLSALSVICLGVGVITTGFFPTFTGLIFTTLLMSFGFHYYETTNQSLILQHFDEYQSPLVMGKQRSMMSFVCILIGLSIFGLSFFLSYKILFILIGTLVILAGMWGLYVTPKDSQANPQHRKMILKKKYLLFYILTLLSGARRQIFMVFSVFLLVKRLHFSIQEITILFVVNNVINYFTAPFIAKSIKRYGEKAILNMEYGSLIIIFTAYAYCPYKWIVAFLYILDHISFNGSMAIRTYFQKIADKQDLASSTAVSFTINHIAAVFLPIFGGYLWMINYRIPFLGGVALSILSLIAVQFIFRTKKAGTS